MNNLCPNNRRYFDTQNDDACRMCELKDDCPLDPDNFDPDPYYDSEENDKFWSNQINDNI